MPLKVIQFRKVNLEKSPDYVRYVIHVVHISVSRFVCRHRECFLRREARMIVCYKCLRPKSPCHIPMDNEMICD